MPQEFRQVLTGIENNFGMGSGDEGAVIKERRGFHIQVVVKNSFDSQIRDGGRMAALRP